MIPPIARLILIVDIAQVVDVFDSEAVNRQAGRLADGRLDLVLAGAVVHLTDLVLVSVVDRSRGVSGWPVEASVTLANCPHDEKDRLHRSSPLMRDGDTKKAGDNSPALLALALKRPFL